MKKIYKSVLVLISVLVSGYSFAVKHTVMVSDFQFAPQGLNVEVGDTVVWQWASGTHTTTSLSVPGGALSWDANMTFGSQTFEYPVTVAGNYGYHCDIHSSMVGGFTATNPNGINTPDLVTKFSLAQISESVFKVSFSLLSSSKVSMVIHDITGKTARVLLSDYKMAGDYNDVYDLSDLRQGIYLIQLTTGSGQLTKRMIIE